MNQSGNIAYDIACTDTNQFGMLLYKLRMFNLKIVDKLTLTVFIPKRMCDMLIRTCRAEVGDNILIKIDDVIVYKYSNLDMLSTIISNFDMLSVISSNFDLLSVITSYLDNITNNYLKISCKTLHKHISERQVENSKFVKLRRLYDKGIQSNAMLCNLFVNSNEIEIDETFMWDCVENNRISSFLFILESKHFAMRHAMELLYYIENEEQTYCTDAILTLLLRAILRKNYAWNFIPKIVTLIDVVNMHYICVFDILRCSDLWRETLNPIEDAYIKERQANIKYNKLVLSLDTPWQIIDKFGKLSYKGYYLNIELKGFVIITDSTNLLDLQRYYSILVKAYSSDCLDCVSCDFDWESIISREYTISVGSKLPLKILTQQDTIQSNLDNVFEDVNINMTTLSIDIELSDFYNLQEMISYIEGMISKLQGKVHANRFKDSTKLHPPDKDHNYTIFTTGRLPQKWETKRRKTRKRIM